MLTLSVFYIFLILNPFAMIGADEIFARKASLVDDERPNPYSQGTSIHHRNLRVRNPLVLLVGLCVMWLLVCVCVCVPVP